MTQAKSNMRAPWMVLGDSNVVTNQDGKAGGNLYDSTQANWVNAFLDTCGLVEMPTQGASYTWSNQRVDNDAILERIDKIFYNIGWSNRFCKAVGVCDPAIESDHCPLICHLEGMNHKTKKAFKFEAKWLTEEDCKEVIKEVWNRDDRLPREVRFCTKIRRTRVKLKKWSRAKYGGKRNMVDKLCKEIAQLQQDLLTAESADRIKTLQKELDVEWEREEKYWHQRARLNWLKLGDRNSKFFHATTIQNRRRNAIMKIRLHSGAWIEGEEVIAEHLQNHFGRLFSKDSTVDFSVVENIIPTVITAYMNQKFMSTHVSMAPMTFGGSHVNDRWSPPRLMDGSRSTAMRREAKLALIRNHEGHLVGGSSSSCLTNSVDLAEACAIRMGVMAAVDKGFKSMIIESDNLGLVNRLRSCSHSMWETAPIEKDIIAYCSWFEEFSFSFVKRSFSLNTPRPVSMNGSTSIAEKDRDSGLEAEQLWAPVGQKQARKLHVFVALLNDTKFYSQVM
ncbi:hypothetical protein V6N11_060348 [Hibiscus sabdariffa]|uniref:RNase H type-1 domain-containing protein n=1 Tax=Hibiscus sabdariffa TaxID=183260 RepID=A0ABR2QQE3_9ROSI